MFKKLSKGKGFSSKQKALPMESTDSLHINDKSISLAASLFEDGTVLCRRGKLTEGIRLLERSLSMHDNVPALHFNLGKAYAETGNINMARERFHSCLHLDPGHVECYIELASCSSHEGDISSSEQYLTKALEVDKCHYGAWYNLGRNYAKKDKFIEAIHCYEKALANNQGFLKALTNMALCYDRIGDLDKAIELTRRHLRLMPSDALSNKNLGIYLLAAGQLKEGWERYEYRFSDTVDPVDPYITPIIPRITNQPPEETRLLVVSEQGLGDCIQFCRFIPQARKTFKEIHLCCPHDFHEIVISSGIDCNPVDRDSVEFTNYDAWIPLLSLPALLGLNEIQQIDGAPYLTDLGEREQSPIENIYASTLVVGIHWQGSMKSSEENGQVGVGRSFPLARFKDIASLDHVGLISLQIGCGTEQVPDCSFKSKFLIGPTEKEGRSLMETANLIRVCDLVITNDTSIAHLSGAMGIETHILLQKFPDWRWGQVGKSTYWYEKAILHRQEHSGCWDSVFSSIYEYLSQPNKKALQQ